MPVESFSFPQDNDSTVELLAANNILGEVNGERASGLITRKVRAGETIRSIGRELYMQRQGRLPSDIELKEFELDTGRRSGLHTKYERDHLHPDQKLVIKLPALTRVEKPIASRTVPEESSAKPPSHKTAVKPAETVARETAKPACSGSYDEMNMIASWVTHNEAGPKAYQAYNPNDMGNGISVGLMQWNQKRGKLPDLLEAWHQRNPNKFDRYFGNYSDDLLRTAFVKDADFNGNATLKAGMQKALADREFQGVQLSLRNEHIEESCEVARDFRFTSLRGRAIVADLINQLGKTGTRQLLSRVAPADNESQRIENLKHVSDDRINAADRVAAIEEQVRVVWRQGGQ
ncbi:MAG: hypothetical protein AB7W16_04145 [Candidatus Obscuribacterales bacterium]